MSQVFPVNKPVAVVIPCYKVKRHILEVIAAIGENVSLIYVVDDSCPEGTGKYVESQCHDTRVVVLRNPVNLGVGGAVMLGYRAALDAGMFAIVKIDGDGQMNPGLIDKFVKPILTGEADYCKGNRFYDLEVVKSMPTVRLLGNAALSFMAKLSTGYWDLFDPTNGYTAIHKNAARLLPQEKISNRYFFETDMLFRLNSIKAVVIDIPMQAKYGDEVSSLSIRRILPEFLSKHARNFFKRVGYNYYLRDMSLASIELPIGLFCIAFGATFGASKWFYFTSLNQTTPAGTVMIAALPIILGIQLMLAFLAYDISSVPRRPLQRDNED